MFTDEQVENYLNSLDDKFRVKAKKYLLEFLEQAEDEGRASLDAYMDKVKEKYKGGTVRFIYGILHRFYAVNGIPWPYRRVDAPTVSDREVFAPILEPGLIREMITAAKEKRLTSKQAFYLAVSTVYGCRRGELASLTRKDIDIKNRLIYIATKKHGRERYHIIPEPVVPYIEKYVSRLTPVNDKYMERTFRQIEDAISFPHVDGVGWHSIRRCLDRELLHAGLPEDVVSDFLRWKRSVTNMPQRYARGTVIGRENKAESISVLDRNVDETVFKVHPFLSYWN